MNALAAMLAKQKEAKANKDAATTQPAHVEPASQPDSGGTVAAGSESGATAKPKLNFMGGKKAATPAPTPAAAPITDKVESGVLTLDDIAESEDEGIQTEASSAQYESHFLDELPATAPVRELPDNLTQGQQQFVEQLNSIYEIVHDPELFGQQIRIIMQELQESPDYIKVVADQDVHVMIAGLRASMGLAKVKKVEKSTKARGGSRAKTSVAGAQVLGIADQMFSEDQW